jgi:AsmA protein
MDFAAIGVAVAKSNLLDKVGGDKGSSVKELLGGADKVDALQGLLGKKKPADAAPSEVPANADSTAQPAAPAEAPKSAEDQAKEKAAAKLKKLLKF